MAPSIHENKQAYNYSNLYKKKYNLKCIHAFMYLCDIRQDFFLPFLTNYIQTHGACMSPTAK